MIIIILGAGQVGSTIAESLTKEEHDITLVDIYADKLYEIQQQFDLRTVCGNASSPNILENAGAETAELLIAATNSDEVNMLACHIASCLFQVPTKIARVRSLQYLTKQELFADNGLSIDALISPEQLVTEHITNLIKYPNSSQAISCANQQVQLVAAKASVTAPLTGKKLKYLHKLIPHIDVHVVAIFRHNKYMLPKATTTIKAHDEIFFFTLSCNAREVMKQITKLEPMYKKVTIAGGGNIGARLAYKLEEQLQVKIIEHNQSRIEQLAEQLDKTIVLAGDATDQDLLLTEDINNTDLFCAVTNKDETNILSAVLAKKLGAKKTMALINKKSFLALVDETNIDITISPQQSTMGGLLAHVRSGDIVAAHTLRDGNAELIEAIAHGPAESSNIIGKKVSTLEISPEITIGAILRDNKAILATDDIVIQQHDHLLLFLPDKSKVIEVEKLFNTELTLY